MDEILIFGYRVEVRRRAFQRRLGVSVYPNGKIRVSANKSLPRKDIIEFLEANKDWLDQSVAQSDQLKEKYPPKFFKSGEEYPYLGGDYRLRIVKGSKVGLRFEGRELVFSSPYEEAEFTDEIRNKYFRAFKKSYRKVAESIMSERLRYFSQQMQLFPTAVQFRGQKTIWGSCSPENKISLNFKLIVAPIQVVDYVLIHELAHIKHKNHSKAFWKLVEKHTDYRHISRQWLREHQYKSDFLSKHSELQP